MQAIDGENTGREQRQEHITEPRHYFGIAPIASCISVLSHRGDECTL
jgi:hypothetical protein